MDDKIKRMVALAGSEREEILKLVQDTIPFPSVTVENIEDIHKLGRMTFPIICPGSSSELANMYQVSGSEILSESTMSSVFLSFQPETGVLFPIYLQKCDFSVEILRRISYFAWMHPEGSVNLECMLWERTGSLLPFFIHNMNNILARIMGNIELAEFHSSQPGKLRNKLSVALESTEELRSFLERLVVYSMQEDNDDSEWSIGNEADILEMGQMSSGTSVKFTYEEKDDIPRKLPVNKKAMNLLAGLIIASATLSVNGVGSIEMVVSPIGEAVEFKAEWKSPSKRSGLCANSLDSSADLLTRAALIAAHSKLSFRLGNWDSESGSVSILVPFSERVI